MKDTVLIQYRFILLFCYSVAEGGLLKGDLYMPPTRLIPQSEGQEAQAISSVWVQRGTGHRIESVVLAYVYQEAKTFWKAQLLHLYGRLPAKTKFCYFLPITSPFNQRPPN